MKKLRRITFNGYIFLQMTEHQKEYGDSRGFIFMNVPNRNPEQVPILLWRDLLAEYLKHLREN
jgi:hypothetical protein